MRIIESYLNYYKLELTEDERRSIANKMFKYIIGSCIDKMYRRAFHWSSKFMIGFLTSTVIKFSSSEDTYPDLRLSKFLASATTVTENDRGSNIQTFGQWLMIYHPIKRLPPDYFDAFLAHASGSSTYQFNLQIATIFVDLLLCSLYSYLCLVKKLKVLITKMEKEKDEKKNEENEEQFRKYAGQYSNAIRILYHVSHSNAMKAFFTRTPYLPRLSYQHSDIYGEKVDKFVKDIGEKRLGWQSWDEVENEQEADEGENGQEASDGENEPEEDPDVHNYLGGFSDNGLLYRRSFMSFVDHYAGLRLLERRSRFLSKGELIKLSLIAVRKPEAAMRHYLPWEEMEIVIREVCESVTLHPVRGNDIINDIKECLRNTSESDFPSRTGRAVINSFKTLLKFCGNLKLMDSHYPSFRACVHCESSLAAILCELHGTVGNHDAESDLHKLLKACPSSHSSSFTL